MDKCLFCDCELNPGSEEHVFLSAIGGRITTRKVTCHECNKAFASDETDKVDDALAESFVLIRNGLKIWSGRQAQPPTIQKVETVGNDDEVDLAPGFVPLKRRSPIPEISPEKSRYEFTAINEADVDWLLGIMEKRGLRGEIQSAKRVEQRGQLKLSTNFDGPKVWRCVAKSAVAGFVVLYGNANARNFIAQNVRQSIRYGKPDIQNSTGWDFTNEWPAEITLEPHTKTPDAIASGFEHSIFVTDVREHSVAYNTFFGHWRFSVLLGGATGLQARGLAINPRATKLSRFIVKANIPQAYLPKVPGSHANEFAATSEGNTSAFNEAMKQWQEEAREVRNEQLAKELVAAIEAAGDDETCRVTAITEFARKVVLIEHGGAWEQEMKLKLDEDHETIEEEA